MIPKKEGTVRFIKNYHRNNQKLVINPHPLYIIGKNIHKLKVLQYDTSIYIKMIYYTIQLSSQVKDMMTIFTEFGKFSYNRIPMKMCPSGDLFHAK